MFKNLPNNFKYLIGATGLLNIGDSFYMIAFYTAVVSIYQIDVGSASLFSLTFLIPRAFSFLYGPYLDRVRSPKKALIAFHLLHILIISLSIACLLFKWPIAIVYVINICFSLLNTITIALQTSIVPRSLNYQDDLISQSVDVQHFAGATLDILSNFVAGVLISVASYFLVLYLSLPALFIAVFFFTLLKLPSKQQASRSQTRQAVNENKPQKFFGVLKEALSVFTGNKKVFSVVLMESFLSGATDVLIAMIPLYLVTLNLDVGYLGILIGIQRACDLIGATIAPNIKIDSFDFFKYDYLLSGTSLLLVFLIDNLWLKVFFYSLAFLIIGISGNFFNKLFYEHYQPESLASLFTFVSTLFAVFGVAFMIVPMIYDNIYILGIVFNVLTIIFGLILFLMDTKEVSDA